jgi:hypothetical protein
MRCPHCGEEFSDDLQSDFCPSCGGRFDEEALFPPDDAGDESLFPEEHGAGDESLFPEETGSPQDDDFAEDEETPFFTAEPSEPGIEEEYYCAWEDRERLGFFQAWWETTKSVLFRPTDFYRKLAPTGKMGDAILFAVIWFVFNGIVAAVYGMVFQGAQFGLMSILEQRGLQGQENPFGPLGMGGAVGISALSNLVCTPVMGLVWMIILAGIYHLILMLVKGANQPFEASLRVVCYSTSYIIWIIIPFCGSIVGWVYSIVLAIIGLSEVHKSGGGKAATAVLAPILLCLTCIVGAVIIGIAIGASQGW